MRHSALSTHGGVRTLPYYQWDTQYNLQHHCVKQSHRHLWMIRMGTNDWHWGLQGKEVESQIAVGQTVSLWYTYIKRQRCCMRCVTSSLYTEWKQVFTLTQGDNCSRMPKNGAEIRKYYMWEYSTLIAQRNRIILAATNAYFLMSKCFLLSECGIFLDLVTLGIRCSTDFQSLFLWHFPYESTRPLSTRVCTNSLRGDWTLLQLLATCKIFQNIISSLMGVCIVDI